jgi:hypothetical protein
LPGFTGCAPGPLATKIAAPPTDPPIVEDVLLDVLELLDDEDDELLLELVDVVDTGALLLVDVLVLVAVELVEVLTDGHVQSARQSAPVALPSNAPPALPPGHVMLPGGSHCSPGSRCPLPHSGTVLDVLVLVDDVVVCDDDVLLLDVLVDVDVLTVGQVQLARQSAPLALPPNAPSALPPGHVMLPGGSHCSPGSRWPFPHSGAVVDVLVELLVVVCDVDVTLVVVVVVTAHWLQQSCCGRMAPPSASQCRPELSTSHFGASGQSRKLVQN